MDILNGLLGAVAGFATACRRDYAVVTVRSRASSSDSP
jgi:hypothetical protein